MPTRPSAFAAVLAAAALAAGLAPAAASATPPTEPGRSEYAPQYGLGTTPPVVTGRPDGDGDGRKN